MGKASRGKRERRELKRVRRSADLQTERRLYSDGSEEITLSPDAVQELRDLEDLFRERFGRAPTDDDPLLWDPSADSDEPVPMTEERLDEIMVMAMSKAGIPPQLIAAYRRTGMFLTQENITLATPRDILEWHAALAEAYGQSMSDLEPLMAVGGQVLGVATLDEQGDFDPGAPGAVGTWVLYMASRFRHHCEGLPDDTFLQVALIAWEGGRYIADPTLRRYPRETSEYLAAFMTQTAMAAGGLREYLPELHQRAVAHATQYNAAGEYAEFAGLAGDDVVGDDLADWCEQTPTPVLLLMLACTFGALIEGGNDLVNQILDDVLEQVDLWKEPSGESDSEAAD